MFRFVLKFLAHFQIWCCILDCVFMQPRTITRLVFATNVLSCVPTGTKNNTSFNYVKMMSCKVQNTTYLYTV